MPKTAEEARLDALQRLNLLDTPASESFDRVTRMASQLFDLPMAAVSLTDSDRQWFKSRVGTDQVSMPRDKAPCAQVAESHADVVIPDLSVDSVYVDSPLGQAGIRFYAGVPLMTRDGHGLGALCVLGRVPREVTVVEMQSLRDLAAIVMAQIELEHAFGRIDPISGLPNRAHFFDDLADLGREEGGERIAVLVDLAQAEQLDNFARVMGHSEIDIIVRQTADLIRETIGPSRTAYHVSATQFALLAEPGAELESYLVRLHGILLALRRESSLRFVMTTVVGVAPFMPGKTSPENVLRALHSAAQDARASSQPVGVFSPTLHREHLRRFQLLQDFGSALDSEGQLRLVFQPRVDMATMQCCGAEVLLRWEHPTLGTVSPGEFIPIIEHSSHARPMTQWVLDSALRQAAAWRSDGLRLPLSVNISATNLEEEDFAARVGALLLQHGGEPEQLELEMTESAIMRDAGKALEHLNSLAALGLRLAVDDFGTGYSSLAYLQRLPMHVVKIDQSFIRDLAEGDREQRLVRSMVSLSKDLGFRVVAEGVETRAVLDLLGAMRCDEAQGYFFAPPLEASDFPAWARRPLSGDGAASAAA